VKEPLDDDAEGASPAPRGFFETLIADGPWTAKSFVTVSVATVAALAAWVTNFSSPDAARFGGSYLGGYFIGWAFRRFVRIAALIVGGILAAITLLKNSGWIDLDWGSVETQVSQAAASIQQGAQGLRQTLSGYLPSAGAGAVGAFFGFRKK